MALLARKGIQHPVQTFLAAERAGLNVAEAVTTLVEETGGGYNVFGHDPGNPVQGGTVTKERYQLMRHYVSLGYPSQGVGPAQLTSTDLLDSADKMGGAWVPYFNMVEGFDFHRSLGSRPWERFYHYNGSGPMAMAYATRSVAEMMIWRRRLKRARKRA